MLWLTGFIALNVVIMIFGAKIVKYYYLLLAFLTLEESVVSAMYVGFMSWTQPSRAGMQQIWLNRHSCQPCSGEHSLPCLPCGVQRGAESVFPQRRYISQFTFT